VITFCVENLTEHLDELKPIFPQHWAELALNKDKVPLDPQYEEYLRRDSIGQVLFVAGREAGKLAAYFVGFVAPGLHYKTCLTLTMDIFYVLPEYRKGSAGTRLFRCVEQEAIRRGVHRVFMGSKLHKDSSALFERLGYEPCELYHTKWLGD
jgi:GNAT superfamily N-acetyltransferase